MSTHRRARSAVAGLAVSVVATTVVATAAAPTASAETVTVPTRSGLAFQEPQNNLVSATFTYERSRTQVTAKVSEVDPARTQVGARIFYPKGPVVELFTRYDGDQLFVLGQVTRGGVVGPVKVSAQWDTDADTVSFLIAKRDDPRRSSRKARLDVFTLTKGSSFTGPRCDPDPAASPWCHDDWVQATLRR